jgi:hypothetical protein
MFREESSMVTLPCGIFVNQVVPLAEHLRQANVDSIEAMLIIWLQLAKVRFSSAVNPSYMIGTLTFHSLYIFLFGTLLFMSNEYINFHL